MRTMLVSRECCKGCGAIKDSTIIENDLCPQCRSKMRLKKHGFY